MHHIAYFAYAAYIFNDVTTLFGKTNVKTHAAVSLFATALMLYCEYKSRQNREDVHKYTLRGKD